MERLNRPQRWFDRCITNDNGCWVWTGARATDGYGVVTYNMRDNVKLHRIVYELTTGEDITGKVVRHTCDNPLCINPDHLLVGTHTDNMKDRDSRERHGKSKLTHDQVRGIRKLYSGGGYTCKQLGEMFGVSGRTVNSLINRTHWKHVS